MDIRTLKDVSIEKMADTFNMAFSDYFVPVCLTPEKLRTKIRADNTDLVYSVGVFEGDELVAFILHGTRIYGDKKVVYNGGTGVVPSRRGRGLTWRMYDFILPQLKAQGVRYLLLEVISQNVPAIRSYERAGFRVVRELECYEGQIFPKAKKSGARIKAMAEYDWPLMQSFWDFEPTWQHSVPVMDEFKSAYLSLGAYINGALAGYLIYNPDNRRIQQLAVNEKFRRTGIASELLGYLIREAGNELSVTNVDRDSATTHAFLLASGFEHTLGQREMRLDLDEL